MKCSDSESECFESAEEDFDDNNEEYIKPLSNKIVSGSKVTASVVNESYSSGKKLEEGDCFETSTKFRKKPKSLTQLANIPHVKFQFIPKKSSTSDSILKTEKISPDAFFQGITRNLSENINKSLSTLQQTSSSVKDLILGTLPSTTYDEKEPFFYDDKNNYVNADNVSEDIYKKKEIQILEDLPLDIIQNEFPENKNVKHDEAISDLERIKEIKLSNYEHVNKIFEEPQKVNMSKCVTEENVKASCISVKSDNLTDFEKSDCVNENNYIKKEETVFKSKRAHSLNVKQDFYANKTPNKTETNKEASNFDQGFHEKSTRNQDEIKSHALTFQETSSQLFSKNQSEELVDSSICLISKGGSKDLDQVSSEKKNLDIEFLKVSHKEIASEGDDNQQEKSQAFSNVRSSQLENIKVIDIGSGDGWDDFDFNENELENINENMVEYQTTKESLIESEYNNISLKDSQKIKELEKQSNPKSLVLKKETFVKTELADNEKNDNNQKNSILRSTKVNESRTGTDDDWGWDNWEDESPVENLLTCQKIDQKRNNLSDEKKWSGWDNFGQKQEEKQSNWNVGSWGVNMLLDKATAVTQGISNALEAGLGAPDAKTLAHMELAVKQRTKVESGINKENFPTEVGKKNSLTDANIFPSFGITSLVAEVTSKIVEHSKIQEIGSKVITGGLDTLETFGKKTMEVLQEGDPGLKNKRALLLSSKKPVLSQVLREAREKADKELKKSEEKEMLRRCHFEMVFDDFQGMVNLEALEMLSRQCNFKLEQIRSQMNPEEQEDLDGILEEVEQLCSFDEYEISPSVIVDFKTSLKMTIEPLKNEVNLQRIIKIHEEVEKWFELNVVNQLDASFIHQKVVSVLAELTATTVHQFHKAGELLSVKECRKTVEEVETLSKMTGTLCAEISNIGQKFIQMYKSCLQNQINPEEINSLIDKVTAVVKNSTSYIRQAFYLLIPVLQIGAAL